MGMSSVTHGRVISALFYLVADTELLDGTTRKTTGIRIVPAIMAAQSCNENAAYDAIRVARAHGLMEDDPDLPVGADKRTRPLRITSAGLAFLGNYRAAAIETGRRKRAEEQSKPPFAPTGTEG